MTVAAGKEISLEYTLTVDGQVVDSNVGKEALTYTQGQHQIVPGLEDALAGMASGDTKQVTVTPEQGYGPVDKNAYVEVKKQQVPPEAHKIGTQLTAQDGQGRKLQPTVKQIKDETLVLDFNHPLAGKPLVFDVKILGVK